MRVEDLQKGFYQFGNKGAVWQNKTHIALIGSSVTLCGTPMLSNNWANITEHQEIHCEECLKQYELATAPKTELFNSFLIGETKDWKFGLCTREVFRALKNLFIIDDTSCGWTSAEVDEETMIKLSTGETSLLDIHFA